MNDLMRPALYGSFHPIRPVRDPERPADQRPTSSGRSARPATSSPATARCPRSSAGELLAIGAAGAYGASMASNYNTRPRAAEVLVSGDRSTVIRARETYEQLVANERLA